MEVNISARTFCNLTEVLIILIIDEMSVGLNEGYISAEGIYILLEGGEHVNMIPSYAGEDSDIGVVEVEFTTWVKG